MKSKIIITSVILIGLAAFFTIYSEISFSFFKKGDEIILKNSGDMPDWIINKPNVINKNNEKFVAIYAIGKGRIKNTASEDADLMSFNSAVHFYHRIYGKVFKQIFKDYSKIKNDKIIDSINNNNKLRATISGLRRNLTYWQHRKKITIVGENGNIEKSFNYYKYYVQSIIDYDSFKMQLKNYINKSLHKLKIDEKQIENYMNIIDKDKLIDKILLEQNKKLD